MTKTNSPKIGKDDKEKKKTSYRPNPFGINVFQRYHLSYSFDTNIQNDKVPLYIGIINRRINT